jgi:hypothetical protein
MTSPSPSSNGQTRLAYILGVPLAPDCQRQWPQMGEVVHGRDLIGHVEGGFPELTLGVGRLYRNVSIAELLDGQAIKVTDYWGEPATTPEWRRSRTDRLDMPADGIWKDAEHLTHH